MNEFYSINNITENLYYLRIYIFKQMMGGINGANGGIHLRLNINILEFIHILKSVALVAFVAVIVFISK